MFFDGIVLFCSTLEEVLANTREVLDCLDAKGLHLNGLKKL